MREKKRDTQGERDSMVAYFCSHPARKIKSTCELILLANSKIMLKCNLPMWTSDLVMLTFNMLTRNIKHKFVFQWIMLQINLNKTHFMIFMTHVDKFDKICQYATSNCVAINPVECKIIQFDTQQNYFTMIKLHLSIPFYASWDNSFSMKCKSVWCKISCLLHTR